MHIMQNNKKPNHLKDLALLFSVPLGIALLAAALVYIPRLTANPQYDFLYVHCSYYDCRNNYSVDASGRIVKISTDAAAQPSDKDDAIIRYYDVKNDSTRNLTPEEAQTYKLNRSSKSADNYTLTKENTSNGFLFWGDYSEGWYLKDGAKKKKISLTINESYYSHNITFLGWVEK